jgi:hypothetical protein
MENLSEVAIKNLLFLSETDAFLANQYKLDNKSFVTSEDDTYDTIYSFKELEYPIYFTFHQIMNHIHSSYDSTIYGYTREELLLFMSNAIVTLIDYYETVEGTDESFEILLDDIEEKLYLIEGYYKYGWFLWLPTKLKEYMNHACLQVLKVSREITDQYINYVKDPCGDNLDMDGQDDSDSELDDESLHVERDASSNDDTDDSGSEDDKKEH